MFTVEAKPAAVCYVRWSLCETDPATSPPARPPARPSTRPHTDRAAQNSSRRVVRSQSRRTWRGIGFEVWLKKGFLDESAGRRCKRCWVWRCSSRSLPVSTLTPLDHWNFLTKGDTDESSVTGICVRRWILQSACETSNLTFWDLILKSGEVEMACCFLTIVNDLASFRVCPKRNLSFCSSRNCLLLCGAFFFPLF